MRSMSLRRIAASLSLAVCFTLLHTPAAHAKPAPNPRGRQAQTAAQSSRGLLSTLWGYLVRLTGASDAGATADPNGRLLAVTNTPLPPAGGATCDAGATADPNGLR